MPCNCCCDHVWAYDCRDNRLVSVCSACGRSRPMSEAELAEWQASVGKALTECGDATAISWTPKQEGTD